jgi:sulfur carrier protein ThiS
MTVLAVYAYADLREYLDGAASVQVEVSPQETIRDVLTRLQIPCERTRIVFLDHHSAALGDRLDDAQRLDLFSAIGGG